MSAFPRRRPAAPGRAVGEEKSVAELMPESLRQGRLRKRLAGESRPDGQRGRFADAEGRWPMSWVVMKDWRGASRGERRPRTSGAAWRGSGMSDPALYKGYKGRASRSSRAPGPGLERHHDQDRARRVHGHHPAPLRDGRPAHIVLKLRSGYNIGSCRRRPGRRHPRPQGAHYKIPEKEFPYDPASRGQAPRDGRARSPAASTTDGRRHPPFAGRALRVGSRAGRHLQTSRPRSFRVFSENMGPEQYIATAGPSAARSRRASRASSSATAPTRCTTRRPSCTFIGPELPGADRHGRSQRSSDRPRRTPP